MRRLLAHETPAAVLVYAMILSVALARKDADANYLAIAPRAAERAETTSRRGRRGAESRREKCHAHPRRWDALRAASIERQHGNTNGDTRRSRLCFRAASRSMCRTHGGRHPPAAEMVASLCASPRLSVLCVKRLSELRPLSVQSATQVDHLISIGLLRVTESTKPPSQFPCL